jgi:hypothetical protein
MSCFFITQIQWCVWHKPCNILMLFDAFCNCIFTSLHHLKRSHTKTRILPWPHIPFKIIWPICTYQYLILFDRNLWHVAFLVTRIFCSKNKSAPLVQHIPESWTHFPMRNDLNSFTTDYITASNKYHFIKAMQNTVCVHFPVLYAKWFAQYWMKTSTDGF